VTQLVSNITRKFVSFSKFKRFIKLINLPSVVQWASDVPLFNWCGRGKSGGSNRISSSKIASDGDAFGHFLRSAS